MPVHFQSHPQSTQASQRLAAFRTNILKSNLSGFLYPWFSAGSPKTLADLLHLAENPGVLRQALIDCDNSAIEMNVNFDELSRA